MNKFRMCPKCKSKKGFSYEYNVRGCGKEEVDFKGNVIKSDRSVMDEIISYSFVCLNCNTDLDMNRLEI